MCVLSFRKIDFVCACVFGKQHTANGGGGDGDDMKAEVDLSF